MMTTAEAVEYLVGRTRFEGYRDWPAMGPAWEASLVRVALRLRDGIEPAPRPTTTPGPAPEDLRAAEGCIHRDCLGCGCQGCRCELARRLVTIRDCLACVEDRLPA